MRPHASSWNTRGTKTAEEHQEGGKPLPVATTQHRQLQRCNPVYVCSAEANQSPTIWNA